MKTFKDIYKFPLTDEYGWVYDQNGNFVFQWEIDNEVIQDKIIEVINGTQKLKNPNLKFWHKEGYILSNLGTLDNVEKEIILIRGWGNLTGTGAHNLPREEAANIQDTFAEHIVELLNDRT